MGEAAITNITTLATADRITCTVTIITKRYADARAAALEAIREAGLEPIIPRSTVKDEFVFARWTRGVRNEWTLRANVKVRP